jgi:hypothetical protein
VFLVAIEVFYGLTLLAAVFALPVLVLLLHRARRSGVERPGIARWLLLSVTVLIGCALAEAVAAVRQAKVHREMAGLMEDHGPGRSSVARTLIPNPDEEIALPTEFRDRKDADEVDLVVIGESSAEGVPYNTWLSVGQIVRWKLAEAIPGRRFNVQVVAGSGEILVTQHRRLAGRLNRRPDALIIYCGHNEFTARFAYSRDLEHYVDGQPPTAWHVFVERVERTSALCNLIGEAADKYRRAIPPPPGYNRALVDVPAYTPSEFAALVADFRRRLEELVAYAERIGALPILIVPPGNDTSFEPNRSFLPARTPLADREAFARDFQAARHLEASDPARAIESYRALLSRQPGFAETHYRLARLLERTGNWDEVYQHDLAARDLDGYPMRCPSAFQDAYRSVASRHPCILIDAQAEFHAIGEHGLLDDHLFHDAMHPSLRGQIALAQAMLRELHARRAFGWPANSVAPIVDPAACAKQFGLGQDAWRYICTWGILFYDLTAPLHYDQSHRHAKQEAFAQAAERIRKGAAPESVGLPNIGIPPAVPARAVQPE